MADPKPVPNSQIFFLIKVTFIDAFLIVLKLISNVLYKKCNRVFGHYHLKQDDLNYFWCPLDSLCKISNCVSHLLLFFLIKWITCLEKNTYYPLWNLFYVITVFFFSIKMLWCLVFEKKTVCLFIRNCIYIRVSYSKFVH